MIGGRLLARAAAAALITAGRRLAAAADRRLALERELLGQARDERRRHLERQRLPGRTNHEIDQL